MTEEIQGTAGTAGFHPAVVMQGNTSDAKEEVKEAAGFPVLSAYTLALRDPGLFSACYGASKKQLH